MKKVCTRKTGDVDWKKTLCLSREYDEKRSKDSEMISFSGLEKVGAGL
jgi:hypothetical protein